jgi:hypothetical protein
MSGFNLAGAGSGIMQGASAGMSIGGPWGAAAGGLLGLGLGGFGGGGGGDALEYGLTPREEELQQYAFDQTKASPGQKRKIINKAKSYLKKKVIVAHLNHILKDLKVATPTLSLSTNA